VRAPQQLPDVGLLDLAREEFAQALGRAISEPFVGVEQDHPWLGGQSDRRILLRGEAKPILLPNLGAGRLRFRGRGVDGARVEYPDFAADGGERRDATADAPGLVLRDDDARERQRALSFDLHAASGARGINARRSRCAR